MVYKIDNIDKRILFELSRNSRMFDTTLAKIVRKSKESVRYRIKRLKEEGIILGFTTWIDPIRLGYQSAKIYLRLANIPSKKREFIEYIKRDKRLFWLGIAEGEWNAGLTFFVKSNEEFFQLKNDIFSKFKDLIIENHTANLVSVHTHDLTLLHNTRTYWLTMFKEADKYKLDTISVKILKELFENSRINIATMADKYDTTVDIVRNRIRKLEENKIIVRYTISIDHQKLGFEFYKSFLYFYDLDDKNLGRLMNYCLNHPNVIHLIKQISPWDVELEIMCENYQKYNNIISEITEKFAHIIRNVETAIMSEDYVFPSKKLIFE
ncbi:MAG: Lrp/AsnC family transcriptional regulator [Nanoarchaeota archaeon]|nr:Lrp/AsnC family transcriptional regulator [Nanoarchaeota archaeon]